MRGMVKETSHNRITLTLGEIKSGGGRLEATEQLILRLMLLYFATYELNLLATCTLIGEIVTPRNWVSPSDEEIKTIVEN